MTPRDFCFWLAGILRMSKDDSPTDKLIREQLDEVIKRESLPRTIASTQTGSLETGGVQCQHSPHPNRGPNRGYFSDR